MSNRLLYTLSQKVTYDRGRHEGYQNIFFLLYEGSSPDSLDRTVENVSRRLDYDDSYRVGFSDGAREALRAFNAPQHSYFDGPCPDHVDPEDWARWRHDGSTKLVGTLDFMRPQLDRLATIAADSQRLAELATTAPRLIVKAYHP